MCHGWFRQEAGAGRLRSDHFPENEEQKTDNGGGAKNCGSHVRVSGAVYRFLPGSESENQKVQDVWPAPSGSGRNLRGTGKGKRYGRKRKKCFLPFFRLLIPTFPWICSREETQEKQVLYPEKP